MILFVNKKNNEVFEMKDTDELEKFLNDKLECYVPQEMIEFLENVIIIEGEKLLPVPKKVEWTFSEC